MKIFFIGTVQFSFDCLKLLLESGEDIVGVATKSQSQFNADYKDLRPLCEEYGIPCKIVNNINHVNNVTYIQSLSPDVIYCFGWSSLLNSEILSLAPKGVVGFHPAQLPYNKGRHPIIWALCLGLKVTGSTFFIMNEGADTGDIISQETVEILDNDDATSLYTKITQTALRQVSTLTNALKTGTIKRIKQSQGEGNAWRKRSKKDGEIDFRMTSKSIHNLVRALTKPYVGAHVSYNGEEFKIWQVQIVENNLNYLEPGKILEIDGKVFTVKTGDGAIKILNHDFITIPSIGTYL